MERPPHPLRLGDDERDYYPRESHFRPVPPADPRDAYDQPLEYLLPCAAEPQPTPGRLGS